MALFVAQYQQTFWSTSSNTCLPVCAGAPFPVGHAVDSTRRGYLLWVELPARVDAITVHRAALEHGISIAPGPKFSERRQFGKLHATQLRHPWTPKVERRRSERSGDGCSRSRADLPVGSSTLRSSATAGSAASPPRTPKDGQQQGAGREPGDSASVAHSDVDSRRQAANDVGESSG